MRCRIVTYLEILESLSAGLCTPTYIDTPLSMELMVLFAASEGNVQVEASDDSWEEFTSNGVYVKSNTRLSSQP